VWHARYCWTLIVLILLCCFGETGCYNSPHLHQNVAFVLIFFFLFSSLFPFPFTFSLSIWLPLLDIRRSSLIGVSLYLPHFYIIKLLFLLLSLYPQPKNKYGFGEAETFEISDPPKLENHVGCEKRRDLENTTNMRNDRELRRPMRYVMKVSKPNMWGRRSVMIEAKDRKIWNNFR